MSVLALDYGRARVGVALCVSSTGLVRGLPTIVRRRTSDLYAAIAEIVRQNRVERIVVGLPLDAGENDTPMSREVRAFAEELRRQLCVPVEFVEESFSSTEAERLLRFRRRKERRDKGTVDRLAACLLLETYLRERAERPCASGTDTDV